jgi:uncharacterized membrane protein YeiB
MYYPIQKPLVDSFAPVPGNQRLALIDALRGLALLGIITANLWSF